jgi:sialic acid synthase SpsE
MMFGTETKPISCEVETHRFRRGGYAASDLKEGDTIRDIDVIALRPTTDLMPHEYVGKTLSRNIRKGESLDG